MKIKNNPISNEVITASFDYANHFGCETLAEQAMSAKLEFTSFLRQTLKSLVNIGRRLWDLYEACCQRYDSQQGRQVFQAWLASDEFGGSRYLADAAMALSPWYDNLPSSLQRLVLINTKSWSIAALKELSRLSHSMIEKLVAEGRQTAQSIRCAWLDSQGKRHLILGELVIEADWQLISEKYEIAAEELEKLRLEAQQSASVDAETGMLMVKTDHLVQALETFGYDSALVLPKPKAQKRFTQEEVAKMIEGEKQKSLQDALATQTKLEEALVEQKDSYLQLEEELKKAKEQLEQQIANETEQKAENSRLARQVEDLKHQLSKFTGAVANKGNEEVKINHITQEELKNNSAQSTTELEQLKQKLAEKDRQLLTLNRRLSEYSSLEVPVNNRQLFVGADVKIIADGDGYLGKTGKVTGKETDGKWLVLLDHLETEELKAESSFRAEQLAFNGKTVQPEKNILEGNKWLTETQKLKERIQELEAKLAIYEPRIMPEVIFSKQKAKRKKARGFSD